MGMPRTKGREQLSVKLFSWGRQPHTALSEILVRLYQLYSSALLWPVHTELGTQHLMEQDEKGKEESWGGGARS